MARGLLVQNGAKRAANLPGALLKFRRDGGDDGEKVGQAILKRQSRPTMPVCEQAVAI